MRRVYLEHGGAPGEARIENESRRRFLQGAAGLTLAVYLPGAVGKAAIRTASTS